MVAFLYRYKIFYTAAGAGPSDARRSLSRKGSSTRSSEFEIVSIADPELVRWEQTEEIKQEFITEMKAADKWAEARITETNKEVEAKKRKIVIATAQKLEPLFPKIKKFEIARFIADLAREKKLCSPATVYSALKGLGYVDPVISEASQLGRLKIKQQQVARGIQMGIPEHWAIRFEPSPKADDNTLTEFVIVPHTCWSKCDPTSGYHPTLIAIDYKGTIVGIRLAKPDEITPSIKIAEA